MGIIIVLAIFFLTQNIKLSAMIFFFLAMAHKMYVVLLKRWETGLYKDSYMECIDQMNDLEFEVYMQKIFESFGYCIAPTSHSLHYGVDFILTDATGKRIIVKTKRTNEPVTILPVQLLTIAKSLYQADKAWIVTSHSFHESSIRIGVTNGIEMYQRSHVMKWSKRYRKSGIPQNIETYSL